MRRRKKSRKLRGRTRTMGWGRIGQHRKTGAKGGRGAAGLLKHEWSWTIKYAPRWFGKHGFNRPPSLVKSPVTINLYQVEELLDEMRAKGKLVVEDGRSVIDLNSMGFTKLLGRGSVTAPLKIIVEEASETAVRKVEEKGGVIVKPSGSQE